MTTHVTIKSAPESHWEVDVVRIDGEEVPGSPNRETKLATLKPGDEHTNHVWKGCSIVIREAAEIGAKP
jgi:hypothetical protein